MPSTYGSPVREVVSDDVMLPRLFLAARSPVFGSEEYYAASVAAGIIGMKKGSRMYRSLVRDRQLAAEAQAFTYDLAKGSDLLVVDVTARPDTTVEQLEEAVHAELDTIVDTGVTADEVARVVTMIETDLVASMQSASERADKLSMFATYFGDPALVNAQASRYRAVTAEQVNAFLRTRLVRANRATLLYVPREVEAATSGNELAMAEAP